MASPDSPADDPGRRDTATETGGVIVEVDAATARDAEGADDTGGAIPLRGLCGNSTLDPGEECDDGTTVSNDGCSALCQVELDWRCPVVGAPCLFTVKCGDGKIHASEACDDGNTLKNDGCRDDCRLEAGWLCPAPGKACRPRCGDRTLVGDEQCDDGNHDSGDGCSSTCVIEPGWDCPPGGPCKRPVCGNAIVENGEQCDLGLAANGLFYGDGKGCTKACTKEPLCIDTLGKTGACATACGDGNIDPGEECDDANGSDGDGCSRLCTIEVGFTCPTRIVPDASECTATGQCLHLPVVYRDFQPENASVGGHPDFYFLGAKTGTKVTTWCVPNSAGPARGNDSTARCWDIVGKNLVNGKPQYNASRANNQCACQFSDWSHDGNGGHIADYPDSASPLWDPSATPPNFRSDVTAWTANGGPIWKGAVTIVKDKSSFDQWFNDDSTVNATFRGVLELPAFGTGLYQYASRVRLNEGGFFPLNQLNPSQATLCNLWPYWIAWAGCVGDQYLFPPRVMQTDCPNQFPLSNGCWVPNARGYRNNSWFTSETRHRFVYNATDGLTVQFYGDDDLFIFINGTLVMDLGGVHQPLPGKVEVKGAAGPSQATYTMGGCLDTAGNIIGAQEGSTVCAGPGAATPPGATAADYRKGTLDLGLENGRTYELAVFHADRHPPESNYQLSISGTTTKVSACTPFCGDGMVAANEECDDGEQNSDTLYGGCTRSCTFGPYCGDAIPNGGEACDLGKDNTADYGEEGCTPKCTRPHYCGDGHLDSPWGESCDLGNQNGKPGVPCTAGCRILF